MWWRIGNNPNEPSAYPTHGTVFFVCCAEPNSMHTQQSNVLLAYNFIVFAFKLI